MIRIVMDAWLLVLFCVASFVVGFMIAKVRR
jgi:hypothetical protein